MVFVCLVSITVDFGIKIMEIEESIILEANSVCCAMGDVNNSFGRILKIGNDLKNRGVTPIYIFDNEKLTLNVHIKETYGKKLS